jgi:exodeoxyribonuclease VII large subunit
LISGVGHEPDWMLIDFAADYRAPTPTGAAEAVVPTKLSLFQELDNLWIRLSGTFTTRIINAKQRIEAISIKSPKQMLMEQTQRLDDVGRALNIIMNTKIVAAQQKMEIVSGFSDILQNRMNVLVQSVSHMGQMLQSLSYKSVLSRGYAIVRGVDGKIISRTDAGVPSSIEFADGIRQI